MRRIPSARSALLIVGIPLLVAAALLAGCSSEEWGPEELALGRSAADRSTLAKGRAVYGRYCVGCHGEKGDGSGPAAEFLDPRPRDFRVGRLKFASVEANQTPRDEDYKRLIAHGLSGTAMPSFRFFAKDELDALVAYVKSFYTEWDENPPPGVVPIPEDPWVDDPEEGVRTGKQLYHTMAKCWSCHPAYLSPPALEKLFADAGQEFPGFRKSMYKALYKDSQWGAPTRVPDFLVHRLKSGRTIESIVRVIATGVSGTAMPTWGESLDDEQLWGLAYYVESLVRLRGTPEARAMKQRFLSETDAGKDTP